MNIGEHRYVGFIYGREWDKEDFKFFEFRKTPLGFDINVWRFMLSYDNFKKVKPYSEWYEGEK